MIDVYRRAIGRQLASFRVVMRLGSEILRCWRRYARRCGEKLGIFK